MRRFEPFTNEELEALRYALLFDDGVRYDPDEGSAEYYLLREIEADLRDDGRAERGVKQSAG